MDLRRETNCHQYQSVLFTAAPVTVLAITLATGLERESPNLPHKLMYTLYPRDSKQPPAGIISISQPWQGWRKSPTYGHPVSQEQSWEKKQQLLVPSPRLQQPNYKDETKRARKIPGHAWNQLVSVRCSCCCQPQIH